MVVVIPELYFEVSVGIKVAVIEAVPTLTDVAVEFPVPLSATTEEFADEYEKVPEVLLIGGNTVAVSPNLIDWSLQDKMGSPLES
jgi:hypothetical protein